MYTPPRLLPIKVQWPLGILKPTEWTLHPRKKTIYRCATPMRPVYVCQIWSQHLASSMATCLNYLPCRKRNIKRRHRKRETAQKPTQHDFKQCNFAMRHKCDTTWHPHTCRQRIVSPRNLCPSLFSNLTRLQPQTPRRKYRRVKLPTEPERTFRNKNSAAKQVPDMFSQFQNVCSIDETSKPWKRHEQQ